MLESTIRQKDVQFFTVKMNQTCLAVNLMNSIQFSVMMLPSFNFWIQLVQYLINRVVENLTFMTRHVDCRISVSSMISTYWSVDGGLATLVHFFSWKGRESKILWYDIMHLTTYTLNRSEIVNFLMYLRRRRRKCESHVVSCSYLFEILLEFDFRTYWKKGVPDNSFFIKKRRRDSKRINL